MYMHGNVDILCYLNLQRLLWIYHSCEPLSFALAFRTSPSAHCRKAHLGSNTCAASLGSAPYAVWLTCFWVQHGGDQTRDLLFCQSMALNFKRKTTRMIPTQCANRKGSFVWNWSYCKTSAWVKETQMFLLWIAKAAIEITRRENRDTMDHGQTMPPWHGGAALLRGARVNWEAGGLEAQATSS